MIYAVGDIHGCLDLLRSLLDLVQADAAGRGIGRPRVVFLGDYIDRGPNSRGVLDLLVSGEIEARFDPVFLLGNHDGFLIPILKKGGLDAGGVAAKWGAASDDAAMDWLRYHGGADTIESYGISLASFGRGPAGTLSSILRGFQEQVPKSHVEFIDRLKLSHIEGAQFFCHAGVDPNRPISAQTSRALVHGCAEMFEHDDRIRAAQLRQMLGVRIVHGHWVKASVEVHAHRVGVDTGAGFSTRGKLSAAVIDGDSVSVLEATDRTG